VLPVEAISHSGGSGANPPELHPATSHHNWRQARTPGSVTSVTARITHRRPGAPVGGARPVRRTFPRCSPAWARPHFARPQS